MLRFRHKSLIGLDLDTCAVRMVQLQRRDGAGAPGGREDGAPVRYAVTGACVREIAPWGDSAELRRIHTVRAIQQGLADSAIEGGLAVCGLRGHEVVVRGFEFPALPPEEIEGAVTIEASQICPFSTDESTLDFQVTTSDAKKTRGFWVAANNGLIHHTRQLVHDAGLCCAMVDVAGLALLNCLGNVPEETCASGSDVTVPHPSVRTRGSTAVLDVGGACTTLAIRDQADRPFVRDIGSGSDEILYRVAAEADVPLEVARTALLNRESEPAASAVSGPAAEDPQTDASNRPPPRRASRWDAAAQPQDADSLRSGLEGACAELIEAITTTLRYHAAQQSCDRVERLLVCGAFAGVDEFVALLRARLYLEVAPWNPLATFPCEAGEECRTLTREAGFSMAVATGLAMRQL
jgi:type IV pilus assembly protein PilM